MGLTEQQQQLASILPHITGFMSWLGSLSIMVDILHKSRRLNTRLKTYDRLMFGMSLCDLCASGAWMMSTWPIPSDQPGVYANYGNDASCTTQGFFNQLGIGTPFYNLCLSIYYYLVIVRSWPPQLGRAVEGSMHFVCLGYAISTAISGLVLGLFGYATFWCWIEGQHKLERWLFWYGPLWAIIVAVSIIMLIIYCSLRKQEEQQRGWRSSILQRVGHNNNNRNRAPSASEEVQKQAFYYLGSFFITWIFLTIVRGMQTVGYTPIPFWLLLTAVTLCPSQGFFNLLIYLRPRYEKHRKAHPEVGRLRTFMKIHPLFACCKSGSEAVFQSSVFQSLRAGKQQVTNGVSTSLGNSKVGKSLRSMKNSRVKHGTSEADPGPSVVFADVEECEEDDDNLKKIIDNGIYDDYDKEEEWVENGNNLEENEKDISGDTWKWVENGNNLEENEKDIRGDTWKWLENGNTVEDGKGINEEKCIEHGNLESSDKGIEEEEDDEWRENGK